jgi:protein-disulfide isomerase
VNKGSKVDLVQANADSMAKYGIQGTPTVFINGKKWERTQNGFVLDEFKAAVEAG